MTPEQFLARLEQALTREGQVFHTTTKAVASDAGKTLPLWQREAWLDVPARRARLEFTKDPALSQSGDEYGPFDTAEAMEAVARGLRPRQPGE
jgi:hypothetical protein